MIATNNHDCCKLQSVIFIFQWASPLRHASNQQNQKHKSASWYQNSYNKIYQLFHTFSWHLAPFTTNVCRQLERKCAIFTATKMLFWLPCIWHWGVASMQLTGDRQYDPSIWSVFFSVELCPSMPGPSARKKRLREKVANIFLPVVRKGWVMNSIITC